MATESCDLVDTPMWRSKTGEDKEGESLIHSFALQHLQDADHAGVKIPRSTSVVIHLLGDRLIWDSWVPIPITAPESVHQPALMMTGPSTTENKISKKNDVQSKITKGKENCCANNDDKNLAFLTTTSTSSTNSINTGNTGVSTGNSKVNTASAETSTASFSDATAYAFLSSQPQGSQLVHEDLEQIHDDDLEEMDLKWNMALLSMGKEVLSENWKEDNHRVPRSKDIECGIIGNSSKGGKTSGLKDALKRNVCYSGGGFDWSDMAEDEIQANMALMAFSDSEVSCSKSCVLKYEALKKQYDDLLVKLDDTAFKASTYKRGLSILEAQVVKYKESEVLFSEEIALLKRSVGHKDYLMGLVKTELEKVKEEKEGVEFKLAKFEKSSKDLDNLLASQVTDKSKKGFGYNAVPSPHPLILNRPTPLDLSYSGLEEFQQPEINWYGPRNSSSKPTTVCNKESNNSKENIDDSLILQPKSVTVSSTDVPTLKVDTKWKEKFFNHANNVRLEEPKKASENTDAPIIEDWVSDDEEGSWSPKSNYQLNEKGFVDSGCSRHMSGNIAHLSDFKEFDGGFVTFGGGANGGRFMVKVPKDGLTCLVAKATSEESMLWHMRLGHVNFKNINKLVKDNLVRDLPLKRFSWVFFLRTKDETSEILKNFIKEIENLVDKKVKIIRSDNGTEFKNHVMDEFCREKGIKREYSVARTPQQNGVAERKNRTLIEAARTMLADLVTHNIFGTEAVLLLLCMQEGSESNISSQQDQDCIFMPIWKDASYFEDITPQSVDDVQLQDQDGNHDDCSFQDDVNTASPQVNTGSRGLSTADSEVNTATSEGLMGPIPTTEDTQEEDQGIDLGNLSPSYAVSSTPHTRIHRII
ncbi:ribonuclease H-like domain-containing protein [Tanacetum coccineum]